MSNLSIILLVVVLSNLCVSTVGLFERNHVVIRNSLQRKKLLMVHCKSKDDDLGFHLLAPNAIYVFGFRDNALLSTLFWCNLWQGSGYRHHQAFVAYQSVGYPQFGKRYLWEAREDGIYYYTDDKHSMFMFSWDTPYEAYNSPLSPLEENLPPN